MTLGYWLVHFQLHVQESLALLGWPNSLGTLRFFLGNICSFALARQTLIGYGHFSPSFPGWSSLLLLHLFIEWGQLLWPSRLFYMLPFLSCDCCTLLRKAVLGTPYLLWIAPSICLDQTSVMYTVNSLITHTPSGEAQSMGYWGVTWQC